MASMSGAGIFITSGAVPVPRQVIEEIMKDTCCPIHLRLSLGRAVRKAIENRGGITKCHREKDHMGFVTNFLFPSSSTSADVFKTTDKTLCPLTALDPCCLAAIIAYLPLAEVLSLRTGSSEALQWAMMKPVDEICTRLQRHERDRIRARFLMQQIAELTEGTQDETVFQSRLRSYADEAQQRRMEAIQDRMGAMDRDFARRIRSVEERLHRFESSIPEYKEENEQLRAKLAKTRLALRKAKGKTCTKKAKGKAAAQSPMKKIATEERQTQSSAKDKSKRRRAPSAKNKKVIRTAMKAGRKK